MPSAAAPDGRQPVTGQVLESALAALQQASELLTQVVHGPGDLGDRRTLRFPSRVLAVQLAGRADQVVRAWHGFGRCVVLRAGGDEVVAVVDDSPFLVQQLLQAVEELGSTAHTGVSALVTSLLDLEQGMAEAKLALAVAVMEERPRVDADLDGALLLWHEALQGCAESCVREDPVSRVIDYDTRHGTRLLQSLLAWLAGHGDTSRVAKQLYVHPNTLRYRLKRAVEVGRIDLDDWRVRTAVLLRGMKHQEDVAGKD